MVTCTPPNTNYYAFPENLGVSQGASTLRRFIKRQFSDIFGTVTVGMHYKETRKAVDQAIKEYSSDNWDGYGARAIDIFSCFNAISFSRLLPTDVPLPEIRIDTDGEVTFEWYFSPRRVLSVTVRANKELVYAHLSGASKSCGVEDLYDEVPKTILDNITRVSQE